MSNQVELKQVPATPLLVVRRTAPQSQLSRVVPDACGVVWNFVRAHEITPRGRHVAVYLNGNIDMEIGVEVAATAVGGGDVILSATPAGNVATATHWGDYRGLGGAHQAILQWCDANGHRRAGPSWEIYGHMGDDPSKVRTDVFYLLAADSKTSA
jgi:effector-binding domain-containing protein